MDYRNKVALAQYPDEDRLYVLQKDTLLSETEMFGEENDTTAALVHEETEHGGIKRSYLICDSNESDPVNTTNHSQKRYRALVM